MNEKIVVKKYKKMVITIWWRIPVSNTNSFKGFILQFNCTPQPTLQYTLWCMFYWSSIMI